MTFRFDNYIVYTERKEESLNEQIALPQKIISGKPSNYIWQYKARSFVTFQLFAMRFSTTQKFHNIFNNIFDMIDFIEILKAFSGKKLEQKKEYILNNIKVKVAQKDGVSYLKIMFQYNTIFLDKFEAITLSSKLNKIISKCEPEQWQE